MKARIPQNCDQPITEEIEEIIRRFANDHSLDVDYCKYLLYCSFYENSSQIASDSQFIFSGTKLLSKENIIKNFPDIKNVLLAGKKAWAEKQREISMQREKENEEKKQEFYKKYPYIARTMYELDLSDLTLHAKHGHINFPEFEDNLEAFSRFENIRQTLHDIKSQQSSCKNSRKRFISPIQCTEREAIKIALEKNLLPDDRELLQIRLYALNIPGLSTINDFERYFLISESLYTLQQSTNCTSELELLRMIQKQNLLPDDNEFIDSAISLLEKSQTNSNSAGDGR